MRTWTKFRIDTALYFGFLCWSSTSWAFVQLSGICCWQLLFCKYFCNYMWNRKLKQFSQTKQAFKFPFLVFLNLNSQFCILPCFSTLCDIFQIVSFNILFSNSWLLFLNDETMMSTHFWVILFYLFWYCCYHILFVACLQSRWGVYWGGIPIAGTSGIFPRNS